MGYGYCQWARFSGLAQNKAVMDFANILDKPMFLAKGFVEAASLLEEVFHDLCALCVSVGVTPPAMDMELVRAQAMSVEKIGGAKVVAEHKAKATMWQAHIKRALKGKFDKEGERKIRTIVSAVALLPELSQRYGGVSAKQVECKINLMLDGIGAEPIRPDYKARTVRTASELRGPSKMITALIVDDSVEEIIKTARALAGWENIQVEFFHYDSDQWLMSPSQKEAELTRVAKEIAACNPQIVLMDHGLRNIEGSDLVSIIKSVSGVSPVFVANTGGDAVKLRAAGCLANCNKGSDLSGVKEAVDKF